MKIISGKYKGRVLDGYDIKGTRPTMDRVKESMFAMIQDYIRNSVILDLYSGTGNLAIEGISNGAKKAYLVDNNTISINTINKNINKLGITNAEVIKGDSLFTLKKLVDSNVVFDIIFLDPPYDTNELDKILSYINDNIFVLSNNGLIVCETSLNIDYTRYNNISIYKMRKYGDKIVAILKCCNK